MQIITELDKLRAQLRKVSPKDCCAKGLMVENNGKETLCCIESCEWLKLDRLLVSVYIEAEFPTVDKKDRKMNPAWCEATKQNPMCNCNKVYSQGGQCSLPNTAYKMGPFITGHPPMECAQVECNRGGRITGFAWHGKKCQPLLTMRDVTDCLVARGLYRCWSR